MTKGVVFLVLLQIFSFPATETRDDFLEALPVSKVLGALDQCNAAQEGLAVDGKAEVHLFELHDEVSYDLHEGEEKMLLLLEAVPWAAERASRQAELGNVVVVYERAPHHLNMLFQQLGVRIELELLQVFQNLRALEKEFAILMGLVVESRIVLSYVEDQEDVHFRFFDVINQHLDKLREIFLAVELYPVAGHAHYLHDARNSQKALEVLVELHDLPAGSWQSGHQRQRTFPVHQDQGHDLGVGFEQLEGHARGDEPETVLDSLEIQDVFDFLIGHFWFHLKFKFE